jgi:hypothetical protein
MRRPGYALLLVLLVIAGVELLTLSTLALATHESIIALAQQRTIPAQRTAEAALRRVVRNWPTGAVDSLVIGQTMASHSVGGTVVTIRRHAWGLYEVVAHVTVGDAVVREAMVLRTLDFHRGMRESNEAIAVAGSLVAPAARLGNTDALACALPYVAERPAASITLSAARFAYAWPEALIDSAHVVQPAGYALAGVRWSEIASVADTVLHGGVYFPPEDSTAVLKLAYAPGDLAVLGGHGYGLLLVDGDVDIQGGVGFNGIIVARGTVRVADDVRISGTLRIQGTGLSSIGLADITYSRCWSGRALLEVPAARRLIAAQRRFIPAF